MFLYKRTISTREYTFVNGLIIFKIDRIISNELFKNCFNLYYYTFSINNKNLMVYVKSYVES